MTFEHAHLFETIANCALLLFIYQDLSFLLLKLPLSVRFTSFQLQFTLLVDTVKLVAMLVHQSGVEIHFSVKLVNVFSLDVLALCYSNERVDNVLILKHFWLLDLNYIAIIVKRHFLVGTLLLLRRRDFVVRLRFLEHAQHCRFRCISRIPRKLLLLGHEELRVTLQFRKGVYLILHRFTVRHLL